MPARKEQTVPAAAHDLNTLGQQELDHDGQQAGEAAKYGIFYDDRKYDYGKHLKVIGEVPDAVFIPAAAPAHGRGIDLAHTFDDEELAGGDGPAAVESDPTIREVLEALEDGAYEDEDLDDDFVVKLDRDDDTAVLCPIDVLPARAGQYRDIRKGRHPRGDDLSLADDDDEEEGEEGDYGGYSSDDGQSLASSRRGTSYAASAAITSIDSKFDQIMRLYDDESDDMSGMSLSFSDDGDSGGEGAGAESGGRKRLDREEIEAALEEFLLTQRDYIRPSVEERKTGAVSLLNELRRELGPLSASILDRELSETPDEDALGDMLGLSSDSESDHYDCQSIITTYTNTENLPGVVWEPRRKPLSALNAAGPTEIRLSRKTGMPIVAEEATGPVSASDEEPATVVARGNKGEARRREETAEEKRARKAGVKEERRQNRVVKKELRVRFQLGKEVPEAPGPSDKSKKKPLKSILRT